MMIRKLLPTDKYGMIHLLIEFDSATKSFLPSEVVDLWAYKNTSQTIEHEVESYFTNPSFITFVAEEEGKLVGYIAGTVEEKIQRIFDKQGYVHDWFICSSSQGKKVGKVLFEKLTEEFKKLGCTYLGLTTRINNHKARSIYKHLGFVESEVLLVKKI